MRSRVKYLKLRLQSLTVFAPLVLIGWPLLHGRVLFWGTPVLQFIPWRVLAYKMLESGWWPLWNPWNGMGAPLLANYQLAWFYPPSWLLWVFNALGGTPWLALGFTLLVGLHLAWAGWGMAHLLEQVGGSDLAQTVAGLAFALSGYWIARASFFSMIWAGAWIPWVILTLDKVITSSLGGHEIIKSWNRQGMNLALVLTMQLLAGHAQLTWYTWLLAGSWLLIRLGLDNGRHWVTVIKQIALALLFSLGMSLIQLLPTAEYLWLSQRSSAVAYEEAMTYSLWPWRLAELIAPHLLGNPGTTGYWGYANYWEDAIYLGFLPFFMALTTIPWLVSKRFARGLPHEHLRLVRGLWIIALLAILLALGRNTPVYPFLYRYVPTFDMFQAPSRWLVVLVFCLSLLGGIGLSHFDASQGRWRYWLRLGVAGMVATMAMAMVAPLLIPNLKPSFAPAVFQMGLVVGVNFFFLQAMPGRGAKPGTRGLWCWFLGVWLVIDLFMAARGLMPTVAKEFFTPTQADLQSLRDELGDGRLYFPKQEEYAVKFGRFFRFDRFTIAEPWSHLRQVLLPNLNLLESISMVNNFDPLLPAHFVKVINHVESLGESKQRAWLAEMNVSVLAYRDSESLSGLRYEQVAAKGRWRWFRCANYQPNLDSALTALDAMINSDSRCIVLFGKQAGGEFLPASHAAIEVVRDTPNEVVLRIKASGEGWLEMVDTWYPGWRVDVDGRPHVLLQADGCWRSVKIPEGEHIVRFSYQPLSFRLGFWVSIVFCVVFIGTLVRETIRVRSTNYHE